MQRKYKIENLKKKWKALDFKKVEYLINIE